MPIEEYGPKGRAPIRTLLVDDSRDFRDSVCHYLSSSPACRLVGQAASGFEGLERVAALRPELVLVDLQMPGMDGLEMTRALKASAAPPRVIVLTMSGGALYRDAAAEAGADAFLDKAEFGARLVPLIEKLFGVGGRS